MLAIVHIVHVQPGVIYQVVADYEFSRTNDIARVVEDMVPCTVSTENVKIIATLGESDSRTRVATSYPIDIECAIRDVTPEMVVVKRLEPVAGFAYQPAHPQFDPELVVRYNELLEEIRNNHAFDEAC